MEPCTLEINTKGVATITLNRPHVYNALNAQMIDLLIEHLRHLDAERGVRVVMLSSTGPNFCVGADLKWLSACAGGAAGKIERMGALLAELMGSLHHLSIPTIALVSGIAYGGGAGLVACCDIALASEDARFCFSEVRLGLIPATISPFVIRAIGERAARQHFLTADRFSAGEARRIGLVHEIMAKSELKDRADALIRSILSGGPEALKRTKRLIDQVANRALDPALMADTSTWIAEVFQTDEAQEGINAFLEKRQPDWTRKT